MDRSRIIQIIPASDWWAVTAIDADDGPPRYVRTPIGAWVLIDHFGEYETVEPMIEGDGCALANCDFPPGSRFSRLAITGQLGFCHCGRRWPHNADATDDVWWCEQCAGLIEPAE